MSDKMDPIANFLFETGVLAKTPRSGFHFLGSGKQSVAEHTNRTVYTGYALAMLEKDVDVFKVMKMCLFHDLAEARTSDLNYVHQKYVTSDEKKAVADLTANLEFGENIKKIIQEYEDHDSKEAIIAKDADNIELILFLKELIDVGYKGPETWIDNLIKRLKTAAAQKLAQRILETDSHHWYYSDQNDKWWIDRNGQKKDEE